jgi:hypothetical protein
MGNLCYAGVLFFFSYTLHLPPFKQMYQLTAFSTLGEFLNSYALTSASLVILMAGYFEQSPHFHATCNHTMPFSALQPKLLMLACRS